MYLMKRKVIQSLLILITAFCFCMILCSCFFALGRPADPPNIGNEPFLAWFEANREELEMMIKECYEANGMTDELFSEKVRTLEMINLYRQAKYPYPVYISYIEEDGQWFCDKSFVKLSYSLSLAESIIYCPEGRGTEQSVDATEAIVDIGNGYHILFHLSSEYLREQDIDETISAYEQLITIVQKIGENKYVVSTEVQKLYEELSSFGFRDIFIEDNNTYLGARNTIVFRCLFSDIVFAPGATIEMKKEEGFPLPFHMYANGVEVYNLGETLSDKGRHEGISESDFYLIRYETETQQEESRTGEEK